MKFHLLFFIQVLLVGNLVAQSGIKFITGNWDDILAEAKANDKIIFMDAYATWCGPCKMMSKDVFPQKEVGDYYNANFINVKMDMEKGEGPQLARNFNVMAYPTLLFIDGEGEIVHRATGYQNANQFLALAERALDPTQRLSAMRSRFEKGDRDPEFLYNYLISSYEAMDGHYKRIVPVYLETQEDWKTEENMALIFLMTEDTDSPMFDFLLENKADFEKMFGPGVVGQKMQELVLQKAFSEDNDEQSALTEVDRLFKEIYPESAAELSAGFRMNYYQYLGETQKFAIAAANYLDNFPSDDSNELNNIAWAFYEQVDDPKLLKKAAKWAEKSVKLDNQYYNNDTLAALYFKLRKKGKGIKAAEKAIALAKANGEDYSSTQEILEMLKAL